jgi:hypothetical protein
MVEKIRKYAIIKIRTLMEVTEDPKGCFTNKEKRYLVEIEKCGLPNATNFPCTKKGKRELIKFIKDECYL